MTSPRRRRVVLLGAAVAAGAAGVGLQLWREPSGGRPTAARAGAHAGDAAAASTFWAATFQAPDGRALRADAWRGRPLLVNFWATWCAPCVTELPMLDRFHAVQGSHGLPVLAVAIDAGDKVQRFVAERALKLPVAIAESGGVGLARALGNDKGGLPYSIVFDRAGNLAHRKMGLLTEADLEAWRSSLS